MKVQEIRESKDELRSGDFASAARAFLATHAKGQRAVGPDPSAKRVRRDIARVKTVMKETQDV